MACRYCGLAPPTNTESRTALIIGIRAYKDPWADVLLGVQEDIKSATAIAKAMGIPDKIIRVLESA